MFNSSAKLNSKIFDKDVEQVPIRKGFGQGLLQAGTDNERVVALCADLTESAHVKLFADKFPERFVQVGITEQSMASVASGMAAMGKIPFIASYAMFSPGRNWEQIRTTIAYNDRPVKIAGSHAGVSVGPDGGTHQAIEDIALTRVIPNMVVISPCDAIEAKKATIAIAKTNTPVYLRLAREKTPIITTEDTPFEIGKAQVFYAPEKKAQVGIIATGALVARALRVAHDLSDKGIAVKVLNLATIKPLDHEAILNLAKETGAIVTVEEHQIAGGMGSAVAECLAKWLPTPQEFIGVKDLFGQSGTMEELIKHYEMDEIAIEKAVKEALQRKK
ncbi:MAG: transketolase C-terminal domain-containing protein [Candidatus Pacebacteria bacterium]|nr:transketolase C-terminal domain-containing protein [Candidatus Paceibacterota bacterium]